MLSFEPRVGKVKTDLITSEFTVICLKKSWQMDTNEWKLGVEQLIREYWDVNCGNYFYFQIQTWVCG